MLFLRQVLARTGPGKLRRALCFLVFSYCCMLKRDNLMGWHPLSHTLLYAKETTFKSVHPSEVLCILYIVLQDNGLPKKMTCSLAI
jgi:hypothetical protein